MNINSLGHAFTLLTRIFDTKHSVTPIIEMHPQKPQFTVMPVEQPFERSTPEAEGISPDLICNFVLALKNERTLNMHGIMILKNGKVIFESPFGDQDMRFPKYTFSACKSVTSLAIGMLIDEGKLKLDDKVSTLFNKQMSPIAKLKFGGMKLEDILTMRTGVVFNEAESMTDKDWVKCWLNSAISGEIGKSFNYNSLNTYMLSVLVKQTTGQGLTEFLKPRLFDPLGIREYYWEKCPAGYEKGGWGLFIRQEDFAKIGQLVMNGGVWNQRRLISESYLRKATTARAIAPESCGDYNYGYQIWAARKHDWFLFNGMLGQNVLGMRDSRLLLVTNAGNNESFQQSAYFKLVEKYFGEGQAKQAFSADPSMSARLHMLKTSLVPAKQKVHKQTGFFGWLRRKQETSLPYPQSCATIWAGKSFVANSEFASHVGLMPMLYQMISNHYTKGLKRLAFSVSDNHFWLHYTEENEKYSIPVGFGVPEYSDITFQNEPYRIAASGKCSVDEEERPVLILKISYLEIPCTRLLKCRLSDDRSLILEQDELPGADFVTAMVIDTKSGLKSQPIIGGAINKVDNDYLAYKIEKTMQPVLQMMSESKP